MIKIWCSRLIALFEGAFWRTRSVQQQKKVQKLVIGILVGMRFSKPIFVELNVHFGEPVQFNKKKKVQKFLLPNPFSLNWTCILANPFSSTRKKSFPNLFSLNWTCILANPLSSTKKKVRKLVMGMRFCQTHFRWTERVRQNAPLIVSTRQRWTSEPHLQSFVQSRPRH